MKKFLLTLVVALISLVSCTDYTDDFNTINNRLDALEQSVPTIEEQIESINAQLTSLKATDEAIKKQISELEKSDKATATEIADLKKKDSALEKSISDLQNYVDTQIANAKSEAAAAYATVEQYNTIVAQLGALQSSTDKLGEELTAKINAEVKSLTDKIADLEARLKAVEDKVENLLARIQSVSYVPTYSDGKATMKYANRVSQVTLDFKVSPKDAVVELANIWQNAVKVEAIYTQTRAVSFIEMPIVKFEADAESGVISVIASGENLSEEFFAGTQETSVALSISDGNSSNTSEYVPMVTQEVDMYQLSVPANQIWYTSTDGNIVEPTREDAFSASIRSNTYKNGVGIIEFNNNVSKVLLYAFCDQETKVGVANLQSIILPEGITDIGEYAFYSCQSLTEIVIPSSLSSIKAEAFSNSYSIKKMYISDLSAWCRLNFQNPNTSPLYNGTAIFLNGVEIVDLVIPSEIEAVLYANLAYSSIASVTIHEGVTLIKGFAFHMCNKLKFVYCKPTTPPKVSYSTAGYWRAFYGNAKGRMIYVPRESVDAYKAADGWSDYADYIVGYDF